MIACVQSTLLSMSDPARLCGFALDRASFGARLVVVLVLLIDGHTLRILLALPREIH